MKNSSNNLFFKEQIIYKNMRFIKF